MNRILVAQLSSNNFVWKKDERFEQRKIRADEIDIYFVNDGQYLVENILYVDRDTTTKGEIIGQSEIKQINTFQKAADVISFIQRRTEGESEYCYVNNVCYSIKYIVREHFNREMFPM